MSKKEVESDEKSKSIKRPYNTVMLFAIIYTLMVIISMIERISILKNISTTNISFVVVTKEFCFPIVVIILLFITSIVYRKKLIYGVAIEMAVGSSMILNIITSVILVGFELGALIGTLIIPLIILAHAIIMLMQIKKQMSV